MDENKAKDNIVADSSDLNKPVDKLIHSPEVGFTDIKPFQFSSSYPREIITYFLGTFAIICVLYFFYAHFRLKKRKTEAVHLPPFDLFKKRISEVRDSSLLFRDYCEGLALALRQLISSQVSEDIGSLTPNFLKEHLAKILPRIIPNYPTTKRQTLIEQSYKLLQILEGGEYGDNYTVSALEKKREKLHSEIKDLGSEIMLAFSRRDK